MTEQLESNTLHFSDMPKTSIIIFHAFTNKREISIKVYFGKLYLHTFTCGRRSETNIEPTNIEASDNRLSSDDALL